MSWLDSATTLAVTTPGFTANPLHTISGNICYTAGGGSTRIIAFDLTNSNTSTNRTDLPFATSSSIAAIANDGTWFYYIHTGVRLHKTKLTAVGAGGNRLNGPPPADSETMTPVPLAAPAQFMALATGPDGTLYVAEQDSTTGPFLIRTVEKTSPYTRTTVVTMPERVINITVDADNVIWALCGNGTSPYNHKLYKASGTPTVWSTVDTTRTGETAAATAFIALCASGQYIYVSHYPFVGINWVGGTTPRACIVCRFAKAAPGPFADMAGNNSSGFADGTGTAAKFGAIRSIIPYGTETLISGEGLRSLTNSEPPPPPPPPVVVNGWGAG